MRQLSTRTMAVLFLAFALAACGTPQVTGVVSVEIPGGDRQMSLEATMVLGANVTAGSGTSTAVTWDSSESSVASIDANGVLTANSPGTTTITATSTVDVSKSDSIVVTVVVDDDAATSFDATYVEPDPSVPPVLGAGLAIATADALMGPTAFTEVQPGLYLGPVAPIGSDGSISVTLPAPDDVPAATLSPVTSFFPALETAADCELVASAPATMATPLLFQLVTIPGVYLTTFDSGFLPALLTDNSTNPLAIPPEELESIALYSYVYADGPTTITTAGSDCLVDSIIAPFEFDVELKQGWNQISFLVDYDVSNNPELITVGNGDSEELFIHPIAF